MPSREHQAAESQAAAPPGPSGGRFFSGLSEAERYARARPFFHPQAIARAAAAAGLDTEAPLALDVACGTGQSAVALAAVARRVIGLDISGHMLAHAGRHERVRFVQARAEALPFAGGVAPILSTALAFHWFEREPFLAEAWRVLRPGGLLLIYNNGFTGVKGQDPAFEGWSHGAYQARFPTPPRDIRPFTAADAAAAGFAFIAEERYENEVTFTPEELVAYLATQTNVAAAVAQVRPYFKEPQATFLFATRAWYLRKAAAP